MVGQSKLEKQKQISKTNTSYIENDWNKTVLNKHVQGYQLEITYILERPVKRG